MVIAMPRSLDVYNNEVHQDFSFFASSSKSCFVSMKNISHWWPLHLLPTLAQFLEGYFVVKAIGAEQRDVHVDLSLAAISGSFFAPGGRYSKNKDEFEGDVYQKVMDNFAGEAKFFGLKLTEEASSDGTKRIFFPKTKIHCECRLLAFLHCNPFVPFVHYIGLSKRPWGRMPPLYARVQ